MVGASEAGLGDGCVTMRRRAVDRSSGSNCNVIHYSLSKSLGKSQRARWVVIEVGGGTGL